MECEMTKGIRRTLFDHFKKVLLNSEGCMYNVEGLAEILDPLMAIEDRERWFENPFGEMMAVPTPDILVDNALPANRTERQSLADRRRTVGQRYVPELGEDVDGR
jgi:hypothetical protein